VRDHRDGIESTDHEKQANKVDGKSLREQKRLKYAAKQERAAKRQCRDVEQEEWMRQHADWAFAVSIQDVAGLQQQEIAQAERINGNNDGGVLPADLQEDSEEPAQLKNGRELDPWIRPYLDLQNAESCNRIVVSNNAPNDTDEEERLFIAEGTETVRLLIQQYLICDTDNPSTARQLDSRRITDADDKNTGIIALKSIFVKPQLLLEMPVCLRRELERVVHQQSSSSSGADAAVQEEKPQSPPFRVLVGSEETLSAAAGFTVSRGCLACGVVPKHRTEDWLLERLQLCLSSRSNNQSDTALPLRLLALDGISDTANLGSMIRTASAFGVHAILLSQDCCDPWYRRAVRVSMGHVVRVPAVRVADLSRTLQRLKEAPFRVTSYAAVLDSDLLLHDLNRGEFCCL